MRAVDAAEIRPEVSGRITEIRFKDGQDVKKGDILFVIEPRPFEAAVEKAEADLVSAKTNAEFAKTEVGRAEKLIKSQAIAQRLYDQRANDSKVADANIKVAQAALTNAQVDLEHAFVRAPISGRTGRVELTVGNVVQAGPNAPLLTTIVSNDGIYADFDVDEQTYMQAIRDNAGDLAEEQKIPVELIVGDDADHTYMGNIYTFDNHIDPASGTIRARAKFANKDKALISGMFVTVKLSSSKEQNVVTVPEGAVGTDQDKKFVYVVGDGNKVIYREIKLGSLVNGERIVLSGLKAGETIIIDGTQHVRPDAVVQPQTVEEAKAAADAQAAKTAAPADGQPLSLKKSDKPTDAKTPEKETK